MILTDDQKEEAWILLNAGGENSDKDIAKKMGLPKVTIQSYLQKRARKHIEKINNRS